MSTVVTAALVLKHQAISSDSADNIFIISDQFHTKILHLPWKISENKIFKKNALLFQG